MSVLTIRAYKRYAVRQPVTVKASCGKPLGGLLIEVSAEGYRISNLGAAQLSVGDSIEVDCGSDFDLRGRIRWAHDGIAGVRLDRALFCSELTALVAQGRGQSGEGEARRYGT